jgi:DNA-binding response OmpR family regulator
MHPHKKQILCVEDDDETCLLIKNLLGLINCEVTTVQSVKEALQKIESEKFDLYLLDNWLPGGSGVELCRRIRDGDAETPIVFYSGAAYDTDKKEAMAAGAQVYLVKPADISLLVATIRELLNLS